jgi:hypothetical protein
MTGTKTLKHNFAVIGNSALLIWWGIVMMVHPLTIGMGAIGTGLIMLGVNGMRLLSGIPTKGSTTIVGAIALVWGTLDTIFNPRFEFSFAMMLIIIGLAKIVSLLMRIKAEE